MLSPQPPAARSLVGQSATRFSTVLQDVSPLRARVSLASPIMAGPRAAESDSVARFVSVPRDSSPWVDRLAKAIAAAVPHAVISLAAEDDFSVGKNQDYQDARVLTDANCAESKSAAVAAAADKQLGAFVPQGLPKFEPPSFCHPLPVPESPGTTQGSIGCVGLQNSSVRDSDGVTYTSAHCHDCGGKENLSPVEPPASQSSRKIIPSAKDRNLLARADALQTEEDVSANDALCDTRLVFEEVALGAVLAVQNKSPTCSQIACWAPSPSGVPPPCGLCCTVACNGLSESPAQAWRELVDKLDSDARSSYEASGASEPASLCPSSTQFAPWLPADFVQMPQPHDSDIEEPAPRRRVVARHGSTGGTGEADVFCTSSTVWTQEEDAEESPRKL